MIPATAIMHVRVQGHPVVQVLSRIESCVRMVEGSVTQESLINPQRACARGLQ